MIFTYEVCTEKGRPPYSDRMAKIEKIEKTGDRSVRFTFNDKADREFPLIIALMPIAAQARVRQGDLRPDDAEARDR